MCRFHFPFDLNGFKLIFNKETNEIEGFEPDITENEDSIANPLKFGASYQKLDPIKLEMIHTTLELLRNHPDMNNHIAELLII